MSALDNRVGLRIFNGSRARSDAVAGEEFMELSGKFGAVVEDAVLRSWIAAEPLMIDDD